MIKFEGLEELNKNLTKLINASDTVGKKAMTDIGLDLLSKSVPLAPIDTGDLRGSGKVNLDNINNFEVEVGYSEPYAVRQHEGVDFKHPQGGQAKYLEQPFRENSDKYINTVADELKKIFK